MVGPGLWWRWCCLPGNKSDRASHCHSGTNRSAGKSSLSNVLIGVYPDCTNCTFSVCNGADSCTKETTYAVAPYIGLGDEFTVVDTPGFGDSDNEDSELIDEMVNVLEHVVKNAHTLLLLFNGEDSRIDASLQQMIREMEALFGKDNFWSHTMLGVSHWSYSQQDIYERNLTGKSEATWLADTNQFLNEEFDIGYDLDAVFIDSWAKQPFNLADEGQQEAFDRETAKLWDFTMSMVPFEFMTIEDVLQELSLCQETLTGDIAELQDQVAQLQDKDISMEAVFYSSMKNIMPVGTILPWTSKPVDSSQNPVSDTSITLPSGWVECNGAKILEGP